MKSRFLHIVQSMLMLSLLITYMICVNCFTHMHVINGVMVVHSHPYNSDTEHSHDSGTIILIEQLSSYLTVADTEPFALMRVNQRVEVLNYEPKQCRESFRPQPYPSLRAPPIC